MSDSHAPTPGHEHADTHGSDDGHHHHHPMQAHHFETMEQQFTSAKLGMWMFLATEVLMFGGLFCAYAIYRNLHADVFIYAHDAYLDKNLGAINTIVLLASSLTMAWGVRAAQLGQKNLLIGMLCLTLLGGAGFMCIKYVEYQAKWDHGVFLGSLGEGNLYKIEGLTSAAEEADRARISDTLAHHGDSAHEDGHVSSHAAEAGHGEEGDTSHDGEVPAVQLEQSALAPAGQIEAGTVSLADSDSHAHLQFSDLTESDQRRVYIFFSIYFLMTGLHGIHVVLGMGLMGWLVWKAAKNTFGPDYYGPVDLVGLYWHLVDLIWIFLFPLLYLIH